MSVAPPYMATGAACPDDPSLLCSGSCAGCKRFEEPTSVVAQRTVQGRAEQLRFLELRSVSGARDELQSRAG